MTVIEAIALAVVQGLTEFLPVSSSGHLVVAQRFLGFEQPPISFDIILHLGTLLAVFIYFRKELLSLLKLQNRSLLGFLVIGSLPVAFFGLFLAPYLEQVFSSLVLVGLALITTGLILLSTYSAGQGKKKINWLDSLFIGFLQALAVIPGVSRSGATIGAGLWRQLSREDAFRFSFLLSIPAILGASLFELRGLEGGEISLGVGLIGVVTAALVGYFSLRLLERLLVSSRFYLFGFYCLAFGLAVLLL
jgi:undecaprenyl-diphosphatase